MISDGNGGEVVVKRGVRSPREACAYFADLLGDRAVERVVVAHLDGDLGILRIETVAEGTASAATLPVAAMLRSLLRHNATRLLVAHNHPSGDPTPSACDKAATRRLATAAAALELDLVDHVVVARGGGVFSFRLEGLL